jgi:hypothetical protein
MVGALSPWPRMGEPEPGYSIILGVPWALRHLLGVNLRFIDRTDKAGLARVFVVFDKAERPGAEGVIEAARREFPGLPLEFCFYPRRAGRLVERIDVSTFFNSMNNVTALARCRTRWAVLHDFDLYPLVPNYFRNVVEKMERESLRFCGLELTNFDGLTDEDLILGTWCLGMDAQWLRNEHKPHEIFHRIGMVNGKRVNLDPYSWLQSREPRRALVGTVDATDAAHVRNLCSTHLRFTTGRPAKVVWRLHYLWYLEWLGGGEGSGRMAEATRRMRGATGPTLEIDGYRADFADTDPTCANVLRDELTRMEVFLHGSVRPEVGEFVEAFAEFLRRHAGPGDAEGRHAGGSGSGGVSSVGTGAPSEVAA